MVTIVLHDPAMTDEVVHAWLESGVLGMTLLDSTGLARRVGERELRDDLPLFPSLRSLLLVPERTSRVIFSVVPDSFDMNALVRATEKVIGRLDTPDSGILFVIPVTKTVGLRVAPGRRGNRKAVRRPKVRPARRGPRGGRKAKA
ncbi:MAG: hypothetical protein WD040_06330 [Anaerolineales bacterium]